jgi:hypothetical protein
MVSTNPAQRPVYSVLSWRLGGEGGSEVPNSARLVSRFRPPLREEGPRAAAFSACGYMKPWLMLTPSAAAH